MLIAKKMEKNPSVRLLLSPVEYSSVAKCYRKSFSFPNLEILLLLHLIIMRKCPKNWP